MMGIAFPFQYGPVTFPQANEGVDVVLDNFMALLTIGRYEVPMGIGIGTNIHDYVFSSVRPGSSEPISPILKARIQTDVKRIAAEFLPQIVLHNIDLSLETQGRLNIINIDIECSVNDDTYSLSVPVAGIPKE